MIFPGENFCYTGNVFAALLLELEEVHDPVRLPRDIVVSSTQVKRNKFNHQVDVKANKWSVGVLLCKCRNCMLALTVFLFRVLAVPIPGVGCYSLVRTISVSFL